MAVTPLLAEFVSTIGQGQSSVTFKLRHSHEYTAFKITFPRTKSNNEVENEIIQYPLMTGSPHKNLVKTHQSYIRHWKISELEEILNLVQNEATKEKMMVHINNAKSRPEETIETICCRMELCGKNLRDWINFHVGKEKTPEIQKFQLSIIQNILDGLKFLHNNGIVHGNLKPENIFFQNPDDGFQLPLKLGDWATTLRFQIPGKFLTTIACSVGRKEHEYSAPGLNIGEAKFNSDIYSLGLIIYEVVEIIDASERMEKWDKVKQGKIGPLTENALIKDVANIISRCTKFWAKERFQTLEEVEFALTQNKRSPPRLLPGAVANTTGKNGTKPSVPFTFGSVASFKSLPPIENPITQIPLQDDFKILNKLCMKYTSQGQLDIAFILCKEALLELEKKLGKNHSDVAKQLKVLVVLCEQSKRSDDIKAYLLRIIQIYESKESQDEDQAISNQLKLALCYYKEKKYGDAEALYKAVMTKEHVKISGSVFYHQSLWQIADDVETSQLYMAINAKIADVQSQFDALTGNAYNAVLSLTNVYKNQNKMLAYRFLQDLNTHRIKKDEINSLANKLEAMLPT